MKTITRLGTFEEVMKNASEDVRQICEYLRKLIADLHSDCTEVPRPGEPSAAYGYGEKKMSEAYVYIMPQKTYANLGFYHGANFENESIAMEGTGKKLRHIKVRNVEETQSSDVKAAILAAMQERKEALGV